MKRDYLSAGSSNSKSPLRARSRLLMLAVLPAATLVAHHKAFAATDTWSGGASGNWNNAGNWNTLPAAGDALVFTGSSNTATTDDYAPGTLFNGITFDANAGAFTLGGTNGLTLGDNPFNNGYTADPLNYAFSLTNYYSLVNNSGSVETVTTPITLSTLSGPSSTGGFHIISGGTFPAGLALNGTFTRTIGSTVDFSGNITTTTLTNNSAGIIGGWATYNNADFASVVSGQIQALPAAGYTNIATGAITGTNSNTILKITSSTGNLTLATGPSTTDVNSINYTDNLTRDINMTATQTLRLGVTGSIFRSDSTGNAAFSVGNGNATGILTAGGNVTGTPGEIIANANDASGPGNVTNFQSTDDLKILANIVDNGTGGTVTLVKTGVGSLLLAGNNTFTGATYINEGTIRTQVITGFSTGNGPVYVAAGSQAYLVTNANIVVNSPMFIAGNGRQEAAVGASTYFLGGAIRMATAGDVLAGPITLTDNARITARGNTGAAATISGKISGAYQLELGGASYGNITLTNTNNNWSGGTLISSGYVRLGASEVIPNGVGFGNLSINADNTGGNATTFDLNGFNETVNGLVSVVTGTGTANLTNTGAGNATLTLGDNNASGAYFGNTVDTAGKTLGITKIGAGTETFQSSQNYHGNTTISNGSLALTGGGSINNSSHIIIASTGTLDASAPGSFTLNSGQTLINNGGAILGTLNAGSGSILSGSKFGSGTQLNGGSINPGASETAGVVGTTLFSDLTINSGNVNIDAFGAGDLLSITSALTVNGTLDVNVNANATIGTYTIIQAGSIANISNIILPVTSSGGINYALVDNTNSVQLVITGAILNLTWNSGTGTGDGTTWDTAQQNFTNNATSASAVYVDGANVNFTDAHTGNTSYTVNISGTVSPGVINVNNSAGDYVFNNGSIGGTAALVKSGTRALTLNGSNSYSGGTTMNAGTLNLGNSSALGSGNVAIIGGTIDNTSGSNFTLSNPNFTLGGNFTFAASSGVIISSSSNVTLTGNSTITVNGTTLANGLEIDAPIAGNSTTALGMSGTGVLTLSGTNTYGGGTTINAGTLNLNSASALGTGTFTINGGTIDNTSTALKQLNNNLILGGNFTFNATQGIYFGNYDTGQTVTLTNNVTITVNGATKASGLQLYGTISGNYGITKNGPGALTLFNPDTAGGSSTFSGGVTINGGTVLAELGSTSPTLGSLGTGNVVMFGNSSTVSATTGGLILGDDFPNATFLNGGVVSSDDNGGLDGNITFAPGTTSYFQAANGLTLTQNENVYLYGSLLGSGNFTALNSINATTGPIAPDASSALRIWATNSTFSGVFTIPNNVKAELATSATGNQTTLGTGSIVVTAGDVALANGNKAVTTTGGYSELNLRNDSGGNVTFPNNVTVVGTGVVILNPLATSSTPVNGLTVGLGNLTIGNGQTLAVYYSSAADHPVIFSSVVLTGGVATFAPKLPGFGNASAFGSDLYLGSISESTPGSGFAMSGCKTLVLTGNNSFTGGIALNNGTLKLGSAGALPAASHTAISFGNTTILTDTVNNITTPTTGTLDLNGFTGFVGGLTDVNGGAANTITNSAASTIGTLAFSTGTSSFDGTIQDGTGQTALSVTSGGNLTLTGTDTYTGATSVNAGATLSVAVGGSISATTPVTNNGTINFNNPTRPLASLSGTTVAASVNLNTTALTINATSSYAGSINDNATNGSLIIPTGVTFTNGSVNVTNLSVSGNEVFTNTTIRTLSKIGSTALAGNLTVAGSYGGSATAVSAYTAGIDLTTSRLIVEDASGNRTNDLAYLKNLALPSNTTGNVGIFSSTAAAANLLAGRTDQVVAVVDNGVRMATFPTGSTNFGSGTNNVDANSILITATYLGDANLDGQVNILDLQDLANHWQQNVTDWSQGDFNGDGVVNILDLQALANHWQFGVGSGNGSGESFSDATSLAFGNTAATPEPTSLALLGLGGVVLASRRRRK